MLDSEPGPPPICKDVGWYQGNVKVIACDDERSAELYKAAVSKIGEVYPGAKLVAIDWKDVPVRPRARLWIPSSMKEPDKLLLMLQRCNPSLPSHDWKVAKIEEMPGPTSQAVIILNKESLAPIDAAGGELNFIRVYKSDATPENGLSDKTAEEDITEELEAPERPELDGYVSDASTITRELSALCTMADQEVTLDDWTMRMQIRQWWRFYLQMSLKILQINLHHCKAASAALLLRLAGDGADVVLIQEPWIVGGKVSGLRTQEYKLIVADSQELISSSQHAYRKGRSTETALHSVIATIEKSLSLKEYTLIAFLDIEGAFNNVFPEAITGALLDLGIESRLVGLISQLLKCRAVTSSLGSSTLTRLLCDIEGGGCQLVAYADDVAMIFTGKYPQTLCDLMTVKLINLAAWADKCGLGLLRRSFSFWVHHGGFLLLLGLLMGHAALPAV
ncbi:hypothetical protein ACLKA6_008756 [Drosophila palustris]